MEVEVSKKDDVLWVGVSRRAIEWCMLVEVR